MITTIVILAIITALACIAGRAIRTLGRTVPEDDQDDIIDESLC